MQPMQPVDILILSNGPGELSTWVRPVVKALRQRLGDDRAIARISLVLSPCPHATGKEGAIAATYPEIDRIQTVEDFFPFLLWGKTVADWDWRPNGVVLFLGGDQFFPLVIGRRLGYRTVIYAEWEARWWRWIDYFGVMHPNAIAPIPPNYRHKFTVVGDLMAEAGAVNTPPIATLPSHLCQTETELIGILPGSKPEKLTQGVPLMVAIAEHIRAVRPHTRFIIPVAPNLELPNLARYANPQLNPVIPLVEGQTAILRLPPDVEHPCLQTPSGLTIDLWTAFPAYDLLRQCRLCLTTVGANTAELGSLAVPMLVLLPTQQIDAMRAWDGIPGLLANLPGVGSLFARVINHWAIRRLGLLAWPNIWAKEQIVPELLGRLRPQDVAAMALDWLEHPEKLEAIRDRLRQVRGQPGAADKLAQIVAVAAKITT